MYFESVLEILDFAIKREEAAESFYNTLAAKITTRSTKKMFEEFALEEKGHGRKLEEVKAGGKFSGLEEKVTDLKIADYIVEGEYSENMSFQDALILAMKREKVAFKLYSKLAESADDEDMKNMFMHLAQEESKHKLKFEIEYDDYVLREN